jgi:hypothetical protein
MMKKQMAVALVLLMLIPVVFLLGGWLLNLINPESAAGHPNYVQNFYLLNLVKRASFFAMLALVGSMWLAVCYLVIRSKERSPLWLFAAALGPLGFAILVMLNDRTAGETAPHERFVHNLNWFLRAGYEVCIFVIIWMAAYQAMVLKRDLMIKYEAYTTGVSTAQIIDVQNASSGMWAFGEGMEVMYLSVLLYLIWPAVFNIGARVAGNMASVKAR